MTEQTPPVEKHADTSCPHCDASKRLCEVLTDRRCCDHCSGDMHSGTPVGFMPAVHLHDAAKLADQAGDAVTRALLVDIADLLLGAVRHGVDGAVLAAVTDALAAATPGEPSPPADRSITEHQDAIWAGLEKFEAELAASAADRVETAARVLHDRRHRFGTAPTCGVCRDDVAAVAAVLTPTSETGDPR